MTLELLLGLLLVGAAVVITVVGVGRRWAMTAGGLFVAAAAFYHGCTEVAQLVLPGHNPYRLFVATSVVGNWTVLVGVALVCFATCHVLTVRGAQVSTPPEGGYLSVRSAVALAAPFYALSVGGYVFEPARAAMAGLGVSVTVLTMCLAAFEVGIRVRAARRGWVLAGAGAAAAPIGGRGAVIVVVAVVWALLARQREHVPLRTRRRRSIALALVATALVLGVSGARAIAGREGFRERALLARARLVALGAVSVHEPFVRTALANDLVYRFDGNAWPALVLDRLRDGAPPTGLATLRNSVLLAVPSAIYRSKLSTDITARNEEAYIDAHLDLPSNVDWLPTHLGVLLAYFGAGWLIPMSGVLGALLGACDRWCLKSPTPARHVLSAGLFIAVLSYEGGLERFPVDLRAAVLLAGALAGAAYVRRELAARISADSGAPRSSRQPQGAMTSERHLTRDHEGRIGTPLATEWRRHPTRTAP